MEPRVNREQKVEYQEMAYQKTDHQETVALQSIGEKIKTSREMRQMTQDSLAEKLSVTRQAVSNWERNKNLPDIYMLQRMAALFGTTLDDFMEGVHEAEMVMPKTPGYLAMGTGVVILLYLVVGGFAHALCVGTVVGMVIIGVLIQLFLHLYFSGAVKTGSFSGLAGYNSNVEYNVNEVKKVLVQMDLHISCLSFGTVLLLAACAFWQNDFRDTLYGILILLYTADLIVSIMLHNYRGIDRTMVKEIDRKTAKAGYLSLICFVGWVLLFVVLTYLRFAVHSIQNNSPQAIGWLGWFFLFLLITVAALFFEQYRAKKEIRERGVYRPGKVFWLSTVLTAVVTALMFFC